MADSEEDTRTADFLLKDQRIAVLKKRLALLKRGKRSSADVAQNPTRARRNGLFSSLLGGRSAKEKEYSFEAHHKKDEDLNIYFGKTLMATSKADATKQAERWLRDYLRAGGRHGHRGETQASAYKLVVYRD
jgi:hypothetical protein